METTIVRYRVKADRAEKNKKDIREVFRQLDANKPECLRHVSLNLADGKKPLPDTAAFQNVVSGIRYRCDEPPAATRAEIVGSYRQFWQRELRT